MSYKGESNNNKTVLYDHSVDETGRTQCQLMSHGDNVISLVLQQGCELKTVREGRAMFVSQSNTARPNVKRNNLLVPSSTT